MSVRLRLATDADLDALIALEASFPGDRLSRRALRRLLRAPSARVWVADADGIAAGLVLLLRRNTAVARIYSLAVAPRARGRGIAKRLVRAAERDAAASGRRRMSLEVRADNAPAQALYARLGYRVAATLPDYYQDGAAGLRLVRELEVDDGAAAAAHGPARR